MRRIIDGYKYDTEISTKLCSMSVSDKKTLILYVNKNGAFFGHIVNVINNKGEIDEQLIPYSKEEALNFVASSDDGIAKYESIFGEIPQAPAQEEKEKPQEEKIELFPAPSPIVAEEKTQCKAAPPEEKGSKQPTEVVYKTKSDKDFKLPPFKKKALAKWCALGDSERVEQLLLAGTQPTKKAFKNALAFKRAAVTATLLKNGYRPDVEDIHYAILIGEIELFRIVVPENNSIEMESLMDFLMYAAKYNKNHIAAYLNDIIADRKNANFP